MSDLVNTSRHPGIVSDVRASNTPSGRPLIEFSPRWRFLGTRREAVSARFSPAHAPAVCISMHMHMHMSVCGCVYQALITTVDKIAYSLFLVLSFAIECYARMICKGKLRLLQERQQILHKLPPSTHVCTHLSTESCHDNSKCGKAYVSA